MTISHTKQKAGKLCGILVFTFLLVLIPATFFDFYYDLNDDTVIKDIISGAYTGTPSGYSIQMLYPLSWFIALFYRAIPTFPWYGLFLCVCQFGVVLLIGRRLIDIMETVRGKALSLALLLIIANGLYIRQMVIIQYSVTSAICMVGAVFMFATTKATTRARDFIRQNIVSIILVIIAFMIRTELCAMLMPFLLLIGIIKWGKEDKIFTVNNFKKYLGLVFITVIGMMAAYSIDKIAYSGSDWTSFRTLFDARTDLYDFYEIPDYDDNKDFYDSIGLSWESYTLLENYNYALDESIDSWVLKSISDYQKENAGTVNSLNKTFGFVSKNNIRQALWLYREHLKEVLTGSDTDKGLEYMIIFLYIICILLSVYIKAATRPALDFVRIFALIFIRSALWLYLFMVDRAIQRVTVPLLMMELCLLLLFIIEKFRDNIGGRIRNIISAAIILVPLLLSLPSWQNTNTEFEMRAVADSRWDALRSYCAENAGSYYVIDVFSSTSYNGAPYSEKIFKNVDNSYKNYDICGGWTAKSPLMRQKLSTMGLRYIQSALYTQRAYFVAEYGKDVTWLERYYENRGYNVEPVCADIVYTEDNEAAFAVYRLEER